MTLPMIVSREEWLEARKDLLEKEKKFTRIRDALNAERRRMPMVEIDKDYRFDSPHARLRLLDIFEGRSQLIVVHFMFDPDWDEGCTSCTAAADEIAEGLIAHLHARDTSLAYISRAPIAKLERHRARRGWTFPWYSSFDSDFNYDFQATVDPSRGADIYNYRTVEEHSGDGNSLVDGAQSSEQPGYSCFLRSGSRIFHTYSTYGRGTEATGGAYCWLDLTALGRQEDWEEPLGRALAPRPARPDFAA